MEDDLGPSDDEEDEDMDQAGSEEDEDEEGDSKVYKVSKSNPVYYQQDNSGQSKKEMRE